MTAGQVRMGLGAYLERALEWVEDDLEANDQPPTEAARKACLSHFHKVDEAAEPPEGLPRPDVAAPGDGEIAFEWAIGDRRLFATAFPDGVIRWFRARVENGRAVDTVVRTDPSPEETLEDVRWVAQGWASALKKALATATAN